MFHSITIQAQCSKLSSKQKGKKPKRLPSGEIQIRPWKEDVILNAHPDKETIASLFVTVGNFPEHLIACDKSNSSYNCQVFESLEHVLRQE